MYIAFALGVNKRNSRRSGSPSTPFPDFGGALVYKDNLEYGRVFQDSAATIPVSSPGDPVGCVLDYSLQNNHGVQVTSGKRPLFLVDSNNRFYLKHDRIDDVLAIPSLNSGTYTVGISSWCGVQVYETYQKTTEEFQFNPVDTNARVLVQGSITNQQKIDLTAWLQTKRLPSGETDVLRLYSGLNSVNLTVTESSNSGMTWLLGDGQTATGTSCVKTITAPQTLVCRATDPTKITVINWSSKGLYGLLDLSKLTGLTTLYLSSNSLAGSLDVSTNTALQILFVPNNLLGGTLKLTTNTALQTLQVGNNLLSGNINISTNTVLATAGLSANKFSGFTGTVANTVGDFNASNNLLSQSAIDAILLAFVNANKTTGTRTLTLNGTGNAAPSVAGLGYKSTLVSRGWTVIHN